MSVRRRRGESGLRLDGWSRQSREGHCKKSSCFSLFHSKRDHTGTSDGVLEEWNRPSGGGRAVLGARRHVGGSRKVNKNRERERGRRAGRIRPKRALLHRSSHPLLDLLRTPTRLAPQPVAAISYVGAARKIAALVDGNVSLLDEETLDAVLLPAGGGWRSGGGRSAAAGGPAAARAEESAPRAPSSPLPLLSSPNSGGITAIAAAPPGAGGGGASCLAVAGRARGRLLLGGGTLARRRLARRPRGFLLLVFSLFDEHWLFFLPSSGCRLRPLCRVGRASGCDYGGLGWQRRPRARQRAPLLSLDAAAALVFGGGSGRRRWRRSFFSLFRRRPAARAVRGRPRGDAGGALPPRPLLRSAVAEEGEARPPLLERRRRGGAGRTGGGGGNGGGNGSDRGLAPRREGRGRRRGRWDAGARAARGCDLCGGPDGAGDGETLFFFLSFLRESRGAIFFLKKKISFFSTRLSLFDLPSKQVAGGLAVAAACPAGVLVHDAVTGAEMSLLKWPEGAAPARGQKLLFASMPHSPSASASASTSFALVSGMRRAWALVPVSARERAVAALGARRFEEAAAAALASLGAGAGAGRSGASAGDERRGGGGDEEEEEGGGGCFEAGCSRWEEDVAAEAGLALLSHALRPAAATPASSASTAASSSAPAAAAAGLLGSALAASSLHPAELFPLLPGESAPWAGEAGKAAEASAERRRRRLRGDGAAEASEAAAWRRRRHPRCLRWPPGGRTRR